MKQYKMILVALLGLILTACYNKFEEPAKPIVYTDEIFEELNPDLQHITIKALKDMYGEIQDNGSTNSFEETRYMHFVGDPKKECTPWELSHTNWYNTGNYYIKGKVISNDEQGNIYKSLHIFDGTAAIELKLTNGLFLDYPCDLSTGETMWVYVKLRGLYLGNFRMMLSIGDIPTSSYNSWGTYKYYSNSNILSVNKVRQHVFAGQKDQLTEGTSDDSDILVVDKSSYSKLYKNKKYLGRLIRFKGLTVRYAGANNQEGATSPVGDNTYPQWLCSAGIPETIGGTPTQVVYKPWYKMAYSVNGIAQYGSILVTYSDTHPTSTNASGVYTVRTSGYSRFAGKFIPKDGAVGDVLAIYSIYAHDWEYQYGTYQLSINRYEDFVFDVEPKEESPAWAALIKWAEDNFPQYYYPAVNSSARYSFECRVKEIRQMDSSFDIQQALKVKTIGLSQNATFVVNQHCDKLLSFQYDKIEVALLQQGVYIELNEIISEILPVMREIAVELWKSLYLANKPANDGSPLWAEWNEWGDWVVWCLENTPKESWLLPQYLTEDEDGE